MRILITNILVLFLFFVSKDLGIAQSSNNTVFPTKWEVNCNGYTGILEYTVDPATDKLTGTLLNTPVEGYIVDRHLILHRFPEGRTQLWEGWIMEKDIGDPGAPYYKDRYIIAGTGSQSIGTLDGVFPWYGVAMETNPSDMKKDPVAGILDGLRWEMPCVSDGNVCAAKVKKPREEAILGGDPNQLYEVTLRFRGVVEYHSYGGGIKDGLWYIGGKSVQGSYNIYKLEISDPPQHFFLNAERAGIYNCFPIDYTRKIKVRGGSKVILSADAQDGSLIGNHDAKGNSIIIPGIAPAPQKYNGQFIQMDVISVVPVTVN